jgi:dTDP-4-amino-4,6-dideoxygalactose transaminase
LLQRTLEAKGIYTGIHYPIPVHLQQAYAEFRGGQALLPVTEKVATELLSLPMYPELQNVQIKAVCTAIQEVVCAA